MLQSNKKVGISWKGSPWLDQDVPSSINDRATAVVADEPRIGLRVLSPQRY